MFETMYAAHGVGLAAPQIGISASGMAVVDVAVQGRARDAELVLANPEHPSTPRASLTAERRLPRASPSFREPVTRPRKVTVQVRRTSRAKRVQDTGEELLARALLHETDHLNGKLYISHVSALKRDLIKP